MDPVSGRSDPLSGGRGARLVITPISNGISLFGIPITLLRGVIAHLRGLEHVGEPVIALVGSCIPLIGLGVASISQPIPLVSVMPAAAARVRSSGSRRCRWCQSTAAPGEAAQ
jgi:hypothetical protein